MILILKATAVLAAIFGVAALLRRQSAAHRHLVWAVGLVALLAVPLIARATPWPVAVLPAPAAAEPAADPEPAIDHKDAAALLEAPAPPVLEQALAAASSASAVRRVTWRGALPWIWAAVAGVVLLRFLLGLAGAWGLRRGARPLADSHWVADLARVRAELGVRQPVDLLATDAPVMPFTVGLARPAVLVPAAARDWSAEQRLDVLRHELAHIRRRDGWWHLVGQVACAVYWFHPLAWFAVRRLRAECERACDAVVLAAGTRPSAYAQHLLDVVRRADAATVPQAVLAMARRSEFEGRLLAILDSDGRPARLSRAGAATIALAVLAVAVPLAAVAPVEAASDPVPAPVRSAVEPRPLPAPREDARPAPAPSARVPVARPAQDPVPDVTTALLARLGDTDHGVRLAVIEALGNRDAQDTTTINALGRVLRSDPAPEVRRAAAWALGEIEDARGVPALGEALLRDTDVMVRLAAAHALGQIESPAGVAPLAQALASAGQPLQLRVGIIQALGEIEDRRAVPALLEVLADGDPQIRAHAAAALGEIEDPAATMGLVALLRDRESLVRRTAVAALGEIEDARAVPGLVTILRGDSATATRIAAAQALGEIESIDAAPALAEALGDPHAVVRRAAAGALAELDNLPAAPPALIAAINDSDAQVRYYAIHAVGEIGDPAAVPALLARLADESTQIRRAVIAALGEIETPEAYRALVQALESEDPEIRRLAARALGNR